MPSTPNRRGLPELARTILDHLLHHDHPLAGAVRRHRRLVGAVVCVAAGALAFLGAFLLRFEMSAQDGPAGGWIHWFVRSLPLVLAVRLTVFLGLGLQRTSWRFASARDVVPLAWGTALGSLVLAPTLMILWQGAFPRSVLAMDAVLSFVLLAGARFSYRLARELLAGAPGGGATPVIVLGAGSAGNLVVRAMLGGAAGDLRPVALLDDDPLKQGTSLQGVPVAGSIADVEEVARRSGARALVLALPTASTSQIYRAVQACRATGLPLKTTPDLARILESSLSTPAITDFRLEDLLHRRPIRPQTPAIGEFLAGRTVLVTGAAGSIGSELCRQIADQGAARVICLDKDENGLFRLEQRAAPGRRRRGADVQAGGHPRPGPPGADLRPLAARASSSTPPPTSTCPSCSTTRSRRCCNNVLRHPHGGRSGRPPRGGRVRADLHRQGRQPHQRHGGHQAHRRADRAHAQPQQRHAVQRHPLRQRAGQQRQRGRDSSRSRSARAGRSRSPIPTSSATS